MCFVIYAAIIVLSWLYCDSLLQTLALSTASGDGGWMTIALGWEIVPQLWPLLLLAAVLSSLLTFLVMRKLAARGKG